MQVPPSLLFKSSLLPLTRLLHASPEAYDDLQEAFAQVQHVPQCVRMYGLHLHPAGKQFVSNKGKRRDHHIPRKHLIKVLYHTDPDTLYRSLPPARTSGPAPPPPPQPPQWAKIEIKMDPSDTSSKREPKIPSDDCAGAMAGAMLHDAGGGESTCIGDDQVHREPQLAQGHDGMPCLDDSVRAHAFQMFRQVLKEWQSEDDSNLSRSVLTIRFGSDEKPAIATIAEFLDPRPDKVLSTGSFPRQPF